MSSGLAVDDQCRTIFEAIKTKKIFRYCVFYIKDERFITVEMTGDPHASYQDFLQDLQREGDRSCRYGLYDFEYQHQCQGTLETSTKQKLFLMLMCPDSAKIKDKMLYASSFQALKKSLVGVHKCVQVSDLAEAAPDHIEKQLRITDRA